LFCEQESQEQVNNNFNFGYVIQVGDGIARCNGLANVMSGV
jgi:F0F1-type ATP synthase alpha subunit